MNQSITATSARTQFFQLLKKTSQGSEPIRITFKEGSAVLLGEEDYESLLETAELLSIPGLKKSIKKADKEIKDGELLSFEEVFGE